MIPVNTVKQLERITSYIDRRNNAATGEYDPVSFPQPSHEWLGLPFKFRPPETIDGWVSEEGFYRWLNEVESVLESSEASEKAISRIGESNDETIEIYKEMVGLLKGALGWDDEEETKEETYPHQNGAPDPKVSIRFSSKEPGPRVFQDFE
jgi:hypothetical protein